MKVHSSPFQEDISLPNWIVKIFLLQDFIYWCRISWWNKENCRIFIEMNGKYFQWKLFCFKKVVKASNCLSTRHPWMFPESVIRHCCFAHILLFTSSVQTAFSSSCRSCDCELRKQISFLFHVSCASVAKPHILCRIFTSNALYES